MDGATLRQFKLVGNEADAFQNLERAEAEGQLVARTIGHGGLNLWMEIDVDEVTWRELLIHAVLVGLLLHPLLSTVEVEAKLIGH